MHPLMKGPSYGYAVYHRFREEEKVMITQMRLILINLFDIFYIIV